MSYMMLQKAKNSIDWADYVANGYYEFGDHYVVAFDADDEPLGLADVLDNVRPQRVLVAYAGWRGSVCNVFEAEATAVVDLDGNVWLHEDEAMDYC